MNTYTTQFNYFDITLPEDVVNNCSHIGSCDDDIDNCIELPDVAAELNKIKPAQLIKELSEYGAWDDEDLKDHKLNLRRILWIASGNIQEEISENS